MAKSHDENAATHSHPQPQQQQSTTQQEPSPPLSQKSLDRSASPAASPLFPTHHQRSQSAARSIHVADISYPESFMRTPVSMLPFPHPKWHVRPSTGEIYEVTSPILEEYDPEIGYIDSVGEVRESIEGDGGGGGGGGHEERRLWRGYVEHRESAERWCLTREGKRDFDGEGHAERKKLRIR
ncbi:uncharacterized protein K460DRAFT_52590 [Cucurbitaria berberidis CBS 394.84]|uniref:Uncharacterized protein n=1 Tax=Cucurbitaria berberidis CBS 394.84 TaxID=1168544 RepID=A0A9P4GL49_9PLEO|nr:uncharacterized protein K460DRAFT_52590 [Cucurbitaria berberidis CBS 394.84]KAF1847060.1 hypothetical protein K460DRAFT_52590 [Cucurbitaria berberidis CBS 394.84]